MCSLQEVYHIDENSDLSDPYESKWKEFKAFIDIKLELLRKFQEEHPQSEIAREIVKKKENAYKTFVQLLDAPDPDVNMATLKYYLQKNYIDDRTSCYYKKNWLIGVIVTGGKFFDISRISKKRIAREEKERELGLPKYEQISFDDF